MVCVWFLAALPAATTAASATVAAAPALAAAASPAAAAGGAAALLGKAQNISSAFGGGGGGGGAGIPQAPSMTAANMPSVQSGEAAPVATLPPLQALPAVPLSAPPALPPPSARMAPVDIGQSRLAGISDPERVGDIGGAGGRPLDLSGEPGAAALASRTGIGAPEPPLSLEPSAPSALAAPPESFAPSDPLAPTSLDALRGRLPESIVSGPQDESQLLLENRKTPSGRRVLRSLAGEPEPEKLSWWQKGLMGIADFNAATSGRIPPSVARKLGLQEGAGGLGSLGGAGTAQATLKNQVKVAGDWYGTLRTIVGDARKKPVDEQEAYLRGVARMLPDQVPGVFGDAGAELLEHEAHETGVFGADFKELLDANPSFRAIIMERPEEGAALLKQKGFIDTLVKGLDESWVETIRAELEVDAEWLDEHEPGWREQVDADGVRDVSDMHRINGMLPEKTATSVGAAQLSVDHINSMVRNPNAYSEYLDPEAVTEEYQKAQAETAGKRAAGGLTANERAIRKEQRAAARKAADPVKQEKARAADIRLKLAEGIEPTADERAFLDEVAKADPFDAFRRQIVLGGSPAAKREALEEIFASDPDAEGWHEVEPETDREKDLVKSGLALIVERGEGDTLERSVYFPEEEAE